MITSSTFPPETYDLICSVFANSTVGLSIRAAKDRTLYGNHALELLFGRSLDELRAIRLADLYHPDDRERSRSLYSRLLGGRIHSYHYTMRIVRKSGEEIWTFNELSALQDDRGEITHTVSLFHDISALKKAEEDSSRKTALLQTTLDTMATAYAVYSDDMRLVQYNVMFERLFDYPPGFLHTGISLRDMLRFRAVRGDYGPGDPETIVARRFADASRPAQRSREHYLPTGKIYFHHRKSLPGGGCVTTYTEVTEQRAAEERLRQSQKLEAIGQLTGGIAHDFNNLLAVMLGNLEMLRDQFASESEAKRMIKTIYGAGRRGALLIQQLLSFSRKQPLRPVPLDIAAHLRGLTDLVRRTLGANIEIVFTAGQDAGICRVDPGQFDAALINLCINARDAMPHGGVLTLSTGRTNHAGSQIGGVEEIPPGDYVVLSVADIGHGMSAHVRSHATEPFFTTKDVGQGSGLGLSMVYGFVRQSGGFLNIESAEGRGTIVTIYLPRIVNATVADDEADETVASPLPRPARKPCVLVVEDDPDVRCVAVAMIEGLGYRTIEAASGDQAIAILQSEEALDMLFTDIALPNGIDGIELARRVKSCRPGLRVLFASGYPERIQQVENEPIDILAKPYSRAVLEAKLRTLLG